MLTFILLLITASLVQLSCTFDPSSAIKETNEMSAHRPWHEHTVEDPSETITARFVKHKDTHTKELCVAVGVGPDSDLKTTYGAMKNDTGSQRNFLDKLEEAKILCISRHQDNRIKTKDREDAVIERRMYSYYTGGRNGTAHRVFCWTDNGKFKCRDGAAKVQYEISNLAPFLKKGEFTSVRDSIEHLTKRDRKYSESRKMLAVRSSWLTRKQKAFHPSRSYEKAEYKYDNIVINGNQQKEFLKKIKNEDLKSKKTGKPILPECSVQKNGDSINVSGFKEVNECLDELSPYGGDLCKFWNKQSQKRVKNEKKITACKLKGRGIIIKQANDQLLRVSSCEHQPASQHFYCSGKLEKSHPSRTVYFEHYGVDLTKDTQSSSCPDHQELRTTGGGNIFNSDQHKSTTDGPSDTINTKFLSFGYYNKKEHCFALDVEADGELMKARQEAYDSYNRDKSREHMRQISLAKVLCISKYNKYVSRDHAANKNEIMYSYYTGGEKGTVHRAQCWKDSGHNDDYICKDEENKKHLIISKADISKNYESGSIADQIVNIKDYDEDKKILRLRGRHMASKQKGFYPYSSREMPEYAYRDVMVNNRDQRRYVKVIKAIKSRNDHEDVLPMCSRGSSGITGFEEKKVCASEFGVFNHYCKRPDSDDINDDTINVCKLSGRGILIKDNTGITRVTACEYQSAANHFYCSGKIGNTGEMKVYFERYGVYRKKVEIATVRRCPNTKTTIKDTGGNEVDIQLTTDTTTPSARTGKTSKTSRTGTPPPVIADSTQSCQPDTTIDNCECKSPPLITHSGQCLSECPDGYTQNGTGCTEEEEEEPPTEEKETQPEVVTPTRNDCNRGDITTNCNCISPMRDVSGYCCNSEETLVGSECAVPPTPCNDGDNVATTGCICGTGKTYNNICHTRGCPARTHDNDNDNICVDLPACEIGAVVNENCVCSGEMSPTNMLLKQKDNELHGEIGIEERCCPEPDHPWRAGYVLNGDEVECKNNCGVDEGGSIRCE